MVVENLEFHIKRTGDDASTGVKNLSKSLKTLKKDTEKSTGSLGKFLASLKRIAFYRVIRTIVKEISKAFDEGLKNAYKFSSTINGELAKVLDTVASLGLQMRNQLGASLGELLMTVAPAIEAIENLIIRLADAMSRLFAVLGGRSVYHKAVASTEKWADATAAGAASAKEWKNQLMGFDEINKLNDTPNSGSGGGSSDSGGNWEMSPANFEWAKQLRDITLDWLSSLNFEPLINAWGRLKESVGEFVSIVDGALYWAYTNVLLPLAGWTIEKGLPVTLGLLSAAFNLLNATLKKLEPVFKTLWETLMKPFVEWIGDKFVKAMETLTNTLDGLAEKVESADSLGEFLQSLDGKETVIVAIAGAIGLMSLKLGLLAIASKAFNLLKIGLGLLTSPITLVLVGLAALVGVGILLYQKFDTVKEKFDEVGKKFSEFKDRFKEPTYWAELGTSIVEALATAIGAAIGSVAETLAKVGKEVGEKIIQGLKDFFFGDTWGDTFLIGGEGSGLRKIGESIWEGITGGFQAKIDAIADWIDVHIKQPFLNGFREAFGIHSPAEAMLPLGEAIFDGVKAGIENAIKAFGTWVDEKIFKPIREAFLSVFGIGADGGNAENFLTFGTSIIEGLKQGIVDAWDDVKSFIETKVFNPIKSAFRSVLGISSEGQDASTITTYGSSVIGGFKSGIQNAWSDLSSWFSTNVSLPLESEFNSLLANVQSWADTIQSVWTSVCEVASRIEQKANENAARIAADGSIYLQGFASGGYPDEGQLFLSRESGPELVGTIGGRTAVVNNQDIVAAVSQGVANAVAGVIGGGRGSNTVTLNVNGREFARAIYNDMKSVTNEKGISLVNA